MGTEKWAGKKRFKLVDDSEAIEGNYPDAQSYDDYHTHVYEFDQAGKVVRLVGSDAYDPEDATLFRSYSWVLDELSQLSEEITRLNRLLLANLIDSETGETIKVEPA